MWKVSTGRTGARSSLPSFFLLFFSLFFLGLIKHPKLRTFFASGLAIPPPPPFCRFFFSFQISLFSSNLLRGGTVFMRPNGHFPACPETRPFPLPSPHPRFSPPQAPTDGEFTETDCRAGAPRPPGLRPPLSFLFDFHVKPKIPERARHYPPFFRSFSFPFPRIANPPPEHIPWR